MLHSYRCTTCNEFFSCEKELQTHRKLTHLILPFRCPQRRCAESFQTAAELEQHRTKVHARAECSYCHKMITVGNLKKHIQFVHEADQNPLRVVCDMCGKVSGRCSSASISITYVLNILLFFDYHSQQCNTQTPFTKHA